VGKIVVYIYWACIVFYSPLKRRVRRISRVKVVNVVIIMKIMLDPSVDIKCVIALVQGAFVTIVHC
jgi:hypothetical protein